MEKSKPELVVEILEDAGGTIVGKTRLQKIAYLLEASGLGRNIRFWCPHYGPFSETLADAARVAVLFGHVDEERKRAGWGGMYSIFKTSENPPDYPKLESLPPRNGLKKLREQFVGVLREQDPFALELIATAVYLGKEEGIKNAWRETKRRQPDKANPDRLKQAKATVRKLRRIETPSELPRLA